MTAEDCSSDVVVARLLQRGYDGAEMRVQFVCGAVGLDTWAVLRQPRSAEQLRVAVVSALGVYLHAECVPWFVERSRVPV